jgi:hypothetical protein
MTVERVAADEIVALERLLHACEASPALGDAPPLGEIMRRVRFVATDDG